MTAIRNGRLSAWFRNFSMNKPRLKRGAAWGGMILGALVAFEIFNFGTTQFALHDVLGDLEFIGMQWATILAIAFCSIDFAGIARIFTPERGRDEPAEVWYLFGAWLLAAIMNASLTWWGVSVAIANHSSASGDAVISATAMTKIVPIFVATMILLIRVLLINTISIAGDRLFTTDERRSYNNAPRPAQQQIYRPASPSVLRPASSINRPVSMNQFHPASPPVLRPASSINRPVPTNQPRPVSTHPILQPASSINRPISTNQPSITTTPKPAQQTSFVRPEPTYHNDPSTDE